MKIITFYFSGTGNTEWAVKRFLDIITEKGHEGEIFSIDKMDLTDLSKYSDVVRKADLVGFANPIYGGDIPSIMRTFIKRLNDLLGNASGPLKPIYFINTFAYINGFGPICACRLFRGTAFRLAAYLNIRLCNNISRPGLKAKEIGKAEMNKRMERAEEKLNKLAVRLTTGQRYMTGIGPYLIPNIYIRKKTRKMKADCYKTFGINMETCSRCMLCVNKCPTRSIQYTGDAFEFLPGCTACMRCYNRCPSYAIWWNGQYADPAEYKRYHGPVKQSI